MGEDREKVIATDPDDQLVGEDVEGHNMLVEGLVAEREALLEDDDVEGHSLISAPDENLVE